MRVTIIPADGIVAIDGRLFGGIDMSSLPSDVHAMQWSGTKGEVEYITSANGSKPANKKITGLTDFQLVLDAWEVKRAAADAPPTPQQVEAMKIAAAEAAVQKILDDAAKVEGYDSILSAASYAALPPGAPFQAEGVAFALWRAQCWAKCYEILGEVQAGTRPEPTIEQVVAEMPALTLP